MSERAPGPRSRVRRQVLRSASQGGQVTVALDGMVLPEERVPRTPEELERTERAADIVEDARLRSQELLSQASQQVSDVEQAGHTAGFERGHAEGMAAARTEIAEALELIQSIANQGRALRDELIRGAEAEIVELCTGLRPAYPDHLPRVEWHDGVLRVNGLYRHGFLVAPALVDHAIAEIDKSCTLSATATA